MTKTWNLLINNQPFLLTRISQTGMCDKCYQRRDLVLSSQRDDGEIRKLCWTCAISDLYELETGNYQLENKEQVITEIRQQL